MTDYSSFGLQDKIAIVTGASQGIGRAIALGLAQAGAHVVLAKHPEGRHDEIKGVQAEIEALGRKAPIVIVDVANVAQVRSLVDQAKEMFGRIDILVNNAGWTGTGPALDVTEEEYDKTMAASREERVLRVPGCREGDDSAGPGQDHQHRIELRRHRLQRARGVRRSESRRASFVARAVARMGQVGRDRERRGAVHHRDRVAQSHPRAARLQGMGDDQHAAAGRWNQPEDLVGAVLFLSSHLSDMVVGHVLMVDGGWTIH